MIGRRITATTRLAAVIGSPVRHSLSPLIHNAAFAAAGLDWAYLAFEVADGDAVGALTGARSLGIDGLSVTMPHKTAVARAVDERSVDAEVLDAVNCVVRRGDRLRGENTDGGGFLDALRLDEGIDPSGRTCVVLGAGGAARAVVHALGGAGAASVVVVNRTADRAERAAALAGTVGSVGGADAIDGADLVVHATPLGMAHRPGASVDAVELPVDPARLGIGQIVVDLVYQPALTPLLIAARERGAVTVGGLGMLIHQAAHAFRLWTGEDPPLEAMSAAAVAALAERR